MELVIKDKHGSAKLNPDMTLYAIHTNCNASALNIEELSTYCPERRVLEIFRNKAIVGTGGNLGVWERRDNVIPDSCTVCVDEKTFDEMAKEVRYYPLLQWLFHRHDFSEEAKESAKTNLISFLTSSYFPLWLNGYTCLEPIFSLDIVGRDYSEYFPEVDINEDETKEDDDVDETNKNEVVIKLKRN